MPNDLGDVLRSMGSVLNPQVAQQLGAEDAQRQQQSQGLQNQVGMLLLHRQLEQQSPEYQAKVQALENEKQFRLAAAQAKGDPAQIAGAAVQYGKPELAVTLYNQQEQRAARIQEAHDKLEARRQELEMKASDSALNREQKDRFNTMMGELKQQELNLQGQLAQSNQDLKRMQFNMKADESLKRNVQQLGTALEKSGLPEADAVLGQVEDFLKKRPDLAEYISGSKAWMPDLLIQDSEISQGKQAFNKLFNITLKQRSGSAVTQQELDRLRSEFAAGTFKTEGQLQGAVDQARTVLGKHYATVASGFGPEALNAYNENVRSIGGNIVIDPGGKNKVPAKVTSDADYSALPSGATYLAPDGSTRKKK